MQIVLQWNMLVVYALIVWVIEWTMLFEYSLNYWSVSHFVFMFKIPLFLFFILFFWLYIWGMAGWRRSNYGKFTRGERKLWFKGLTSFWVGEFATLLGILFAAAWMSWGPLPLMPRQFLASRKGFFIEITIISYIIWLIYILRFSLKWYLWKTQFLIVLFILVISTYLLWRDFLMLFTREPLTTFYGTRWRYIKMKSMIFSMDSFWWLDHHLGKTRTLNSIYICMNTVMSREPFQPEGLYIDMNQLPMLTEYERSYLLSYLDQKHTAFYMCPFHIFPIYNYRQTNIWMVEYPDVLSFFNRLWYRDSYIFFPRKIGYLPKKLAMWYFILVLKIWHHLMLYIWWFFYLFRLKTLKKNSYSMVSMCYFNVYCCFIIAWFSYIYQHYPFLEIYLKEKPKPLHGDYIYKLLYEIFWYLYYVLIVMDTNYTSMASQMDKYLITFGQTYMIPFHDLLDVPEDIISI